LQRAAVEGWSYLFGSVKPFQINFFAALHKKCLTHHLIALKYDLLQRTKYGAADTNKSNSSF
jgi:hypothetical protein